MSTNNVQINIIGDLVTIRYQEGVTDSDVHHANGVLLGMLARKRPFAVAVEFASERPSLSHASIAGAFVEANKAEFRKWCVGSANVMRSLAWRTAMRGMMLTRQSPFRLTACADLAEAHAWCRARLDEAATTAVQA